MYHRKHKPKGQQPVDVKKLENQKLFNKKLNSDPKNKLENIRKRRFEDIIHWCGGKGSIKKFYGWLWWFCGDKRGGRGNWYHRDAVQPMRDMVKMIPGNQLNYNYLTFDNVDDETIVFIKRSSKRTDYFDEHQWRDIINFIKCHNTNEIIKKIIFCVYDDNDNPVKVREKEWKFIENAGCDYLKDMSSYFWREKTTLSQESVHWLLKGKLFKIKY